jgi:hypothetical protein
VRSAPSTSSAHVTARPASSYIGNHETLNPNEAELRDDGWHVVRFKVRQYRRDQKLDLPRGPAADALGVTGLSVPHDDHGNGLGPAPPDPPGAVPF